MLDLVGLAPARRRPVKDFSLGMRQRLGLAAALLGHPELLVLDEPANGLDPEGVRWLRDFLRVYAAPGGTVLISSHVLAEVAQTVDRVLIIKQGKLVTESSLDDLTERVGASVRVRTPVPGRMQEALAQASLRFSLSQPGVLQVHGTTIEQVGDVAFEAGVRLHELAAAASSREEVLGAHFGELDVSAQLRAELLKLRSTRTTLALVLAMLALVLVWRHVTARRVDRSSARWAAYS